MKLINSYPLVIITLVLYLMFFATYHYSPFNNILFVSEDNVGEYAQFFLYLLAAIFTFGATYNQSKSYPINWLKYFWALLFIVMALVEIDWGSRIFSASELITDGQTLYDMTGISQLLSIIDNKILYILIFMVFAAVIPLFEEKFLVKYFQGYKPYFANHDYVIAMLLNLFLVMKMYFSKNSAFYEFTELMIAVSFFYLSRQQLEKNMGNLPLWVLIFALGFSYFNIGHSSQLINFNPDSIITRRVLREKDYDRAKTLINQIMERNKNDLYFWGYLPQGNSARSFLLSHLYSITGNEELRQKYLKDSYQMASLKLSQYRYLQWMIKSSAGKNTMSPKKLKRLGYNFKEFDQTLGINYSSIIKNLILNESVSTPNLESQLTEFYRALYHRQELEIRNLASK